MKKGIGCIIVCVFLLTTSPSFYSFDWTGNIHVGYSEIENNAFITNINWNTDDSLEIILPSTYDNIQVKELGGYYGRGVPSPFNISTDIEAMFPNADEYFSTNESYLYEDNLDRWDSREVNTFKFI